MAVEKPRIYQGTRDIILSLGSILLIVAVTIGFTGMCSFDRGNKDNAPIQRVDARTFLEMEARGADFAVRYPGEIEGWQANSARRITIAKASAPVVGWVVNKDSYVQLAQTGVDKDEAIKRYDGNLRTRSGEHSLGGKVVEEYSSEDRDVRDIWVVDLGDARVIISGAAPRAEFDRVITKMIEASPLPGPASQ
ncbi:DUF4245 domain-containing protein [Corynebacterium diphtheriae]|uniref:DUF4245 domain-containing protein n=1 Tax=Corynebacterium diphtheriae TaxID=1717 RepID=UPI0013CB9EA1|nr:hypothetical protein CIP107514_00829 [Corynebacterium diphtheriae]CAB0643309.1 hypothetical protein CIP107575_00941 [Corynebacterium diphtheriae]